METWREEQPRRVVVVLSFHFHASAAELACGRSRSQYTEKTTSEREFVVGFAVH